MSRSKQTLYFTDPPLGRRKFFSDPRRELSFSGVSSLYGGEVRLVSTDLGGPNGMALSPDEKCLYIGKWDEKNKVVMRCEANADGMLSNGQVFCDTTLAPGEDAIDGIKSEP